MIGDCPICSGGEKHQRIIFGVTGDRRERRRRVVMYYKSVGDESRLCDDCISIADHGGGEEKKPKRTVEA